MRSPNKKTIKKPLKLTLSMIIAATTGVIYENNMLFNVKIAYQDILQTIDMFDRNIEITIIGHSCGAIKHLC